MISRKELADMSENEFSELISDVLMIALVKGGKADRQIPDKINLICETDNLEFMFDIDVNVKLKDCGREAFKEFLRQHGRTVHFFKPGELNE